MTTCAALVVPISWALNARLAGDSEASGAMPLPVNGMLCGLFAALSVKVKVPERVPRVEGVNVTLIVQLARAASEVPQLLVGAKSPVATILEIATAPSPVLVNVAVWGALVVPTRCALKVRLAGESATLGAAPVPVNAMLCGLVPALSVRVTAPVRVPSAVGVKVI